MAVFGITRKQNMGPTMELDPAFDPSNPNHSTGVSEAYFSDGSWKINVRSISDIEDIADKYGTLSVVFRREAIPTIVLNDRPDKAPATLLLERRS